MVITIALCLIIIALLGYVVRENAKRFDAIEKAINGVAVNGPLVRVDREQKLVPIEPLSKRARRTMYERAIEKAYQNRTEK